MSRIQDTLFESARMNLEDSISLSLASLDTYGQSHKHWAVAYSGGKDSSATVTFVAWAILTGQVSAPESLSVLYADTRMELPPLQKTAFDLLDKLKSQGFRTQVVWPELDRRFYVYMFGRGVPPPKNRFRWCTPMLKIEPMSKALKGLRERAGEKLLMITGVRLGESAARDQRIAFSCSKDSGECGQGWYQSATDTSVADTLAPLLHWRICHVYDWLYFEQGRHGYDVHDIAAVYGEEEVRTGCVGCNLASRDTALIRLVRNPEWEHLKPLLELKPFYAELIKSKWRKRKAEPEILKDGSRSKNGQRMGPLTMAGRAYGLDKILDIQARAKVDLINPEEEARIRELWALNTWPEKWSEDDIEANRPIDLRLFRDGHMITQALLIR